MHARTIAITVMLLLTACSDQWRTSDPQLDSAKMLQMLSDLNSKADQSNDPNLIAEAWSWKDDPAVTIYFSDSGGPLGKVKTVLAFGNLDFLGAVEAATGTPLKLADVAYANVFFFDNPHIDGGHKEILVVGVATKDAADNVTYHAFSGPGTFNSQKLSAKMTGINTQPITLISDDVKGGALNSSIQLRVYSTLTDNPGKNNFLGKFSRLAGYK